MCGICLKKWIKMTFNLLLLILLLFEKATSLENSMNLMNNAIYIWALSVRTVLFFISWTLHCSFRWKTPKNLIFFAFVSAWNVLLEIGEVTIRSQTHTALYPLIFFMQHHVSFQIVFPIWIYSEVANDASKIRYCIYL